MVVVSHAHRFVFLKTAKAAGTSMEIALSSWCEDGDIITPISGRDEAIRTQLGFRGPQNHRVSSHPQKNGKAWKISRHARAVNVRRFIGQPSWDEYFKFCVVRSPWERVMSQYYWRNQKPPRPTLDEFLESKAPQRLDSMGYQVYTTDGRVVVDQCLQYDRLREEIAQLAQRLQLPQLPQLPRAKAGIRPPTATVRRMTRNQVDRIGDLFHEEIALHGFQPPELR